MQTNVEIEYNGGTKVFTLKTILAKDWNRLQEMLLPKTIRQDGQFDISTAALKEYNKQLILESIKAAGGEVDLDKIDAIAYQMLQEKATEIHTISPQKEKN